MIGFYNTIGVRQMNAIRASLQTNRIDERGGLVVTLQIAALGDPGSNPGSR